MGDEEMERFEITDYDIAYEFNPNRPRRKMSKKQQMLGIWAEDSDDEDERPSFSRKQPKDYSAPVSFIAGGIQQAGKPKEKKESDDDDDEDNEDRPRLGGPVNSSSEESDNDVKIVGSSKPAFGVSATTRNEFAGMRSKNLFSNNKLMASWEQSTKGFGTKMMLKMGYEPGKGLGKNLQGISTPVEAHLRKGRGAIGAYGSEKGPKLAQVTNKMEIAETEAKKKEAKKISHWKKTGIENIPRPSYGKSLDEVLEQGRLRNNRKMPAINPELAKVTVIDMTGPRQKVLKGYQAISSTQQRPNEEFCTTFAKKKTLNFNMPELQHNLDAIVDMCEQDIIQNDRRTNYLRDRVITLEAEKQTLSKVIDETTHSIGALEKALARVNMLVDRQESMSLKETYEAFKSLQDNYSEECQAYNLGGLAISFVLPKIKNELMIWNPLVDPQAPIELFRNWKSLLDKYPMSRDVTAYDQLVWNALMPKFQGAINEWQCRQPEKLVDLVEYWEHLLPSYVRENLISMYIFPKLHLEVDLWNPLTDTVPIHTWIHPWLPIMQNRMDDSIYPVIRRKLGSALGAWHPSDRSAIRILEPWSQVFAKNDMENFLKKNIVPQLKLVLEQMEINPYQQHLDHWNWVFDWKELISPQILAALLDEFFFPKWLRTLSSWLNQSPNFDQVTEWFKGWKNLVSEKILADPKVKERFNEALRMMNKTVATRQNLPPGSLEQVSYLTCMERTQAAQTQQIPVYTPKMARLAETIRLAHQMIPEKNFKDEVQKNCEQRGIVFLPQPNRYREGKQVYKIGKVLAYIDGGSIFVNKNGTDWKPTNLNILLDTADI